MDVGKFPCNIVMITLSLTPPIPGATVLKVGLSKLSDSPGTSVVSSVDKLGVAASTSPQPSDQDLLHKQQVGNYLELRR